MSDAYPLVIIDWLDSRQPRAAWTFVDELPEPAPVRCRTAGWLIHDGEDVKRVALSLGDVDGDAPQASGVVDIPTRCVTAIHRGQLLVWSDPELPVQSFDEAFAEASAAAREAIARTTRPRSGAEEEQARQAGAALGAPNPHEDLIRAS